MQAQSEKEAPRKLVKKSRRSAAAVGASDGASVLSYDYAEGSSSLAEEEEGNLLEEQEPTNMVYDETNMDDLDGGRAIAEPFVAAPHVPSTPTVQRISAVGSGGPVYLLLALPRFGLHAAQTTLDYSLSTTRSIALLPFHVASHLPLIGGYVPFSSSSQSTTAFAPREPSSASEGEPRKAGIVWQAAELGLGLTIAGVLVAGAGASMMWDTLGGGKRKARA